jgi:branched-chain amino acid transport system substrate-binding protein
MVSGSVSAAADDDVIKIGLLMVRTGALAQGGMQLEQGLTCFLRERGGLLGRYRAMLYAVDTAGTPAGARTKVEELVERNEVDVVIGPHTTFEVLAIADYLRDRRVPLICTSGGEDITQRRVSPFIIRVSVSSAQCMHVLGDYAANDLKFRRAITIADDTAFGYEQMAGFQRVFEASGGRVIKKLWSPLVTPDYTPYLAQIENVDCVITGFSGASRLKFLRAYSELGMKRRFPVLAGWTAMDDALLPSFGDEAIDVLSAHWYSASFDTPTNRSLVSDMKRYFAATPGGYSAGAYTAGLCLEAALENLGSTPKSGDRLAEALHGVTLDNTPRGPLNLDKFGNAVGDVYIRRCERAGDILANRVIKRYPNVSQFWTFDSKTFLSEPVYSRDYQSGRI